jgi:DNA-binding transcriptional ArsR family regulator
MPADQAELIAEIFAGLGDPTRARIVFALTRGEYSVNALADMAGVSASAVSHHLARLRSIRLVRSRRSGNQVFYTVDDEHVSRLFYEVMQHLDHIRRNLPAVSVTLLDELTGVEENLEEQ